jgi:hypothetical protein
MRPFFRLARLILPLLLLVVVAALVYFFVFRARPGVAYGAAVALCPGPDQYGYTCEGADGYAYLDAATDSGLYLDDGVVALELPFPFTFYGTAYTEVVASVNGNLQFSSENPLYRLSCLADGPVAEMGDLIAPYWTDLDLRTTGFLETATMGTAPQRIFVIEWDGIPRFGSDPAETVTFEVQLFEGSNDIVFLYEDTTSPTGSNGSSALVGLQSEAQGVALQYSCNQPVIADGDGLRFPHPAEPNPELGMAEMVREQGGRGAGEQGSGGAEETREVKEPVRTLLDGLERGGAAVLPALRGEWLSGRPPRAFLWQTLDLTGDGTDEMVALWFGQPAHPELAEVAVLALASGGQEQVGQRVLLHAPLSTRQMPVGEVLVAETADLTGDRRPDLLLHDPQTGRLFVLAAPQLAAEAEPGVALYPIAEACHGSLVVRDSNNDGLAEIIRDGCATPGRLHTVWDGESFSQAWDADFSW